MIITINLSSQVSDSIFLQAGYSNQSYYNLNSGEVLNVNNNDWDIAFGLGGYGSSIRINGQSGTELYIYPSSDNSGWATLDTNGINTWSKLYNSDTSWSYGAFDKGSSPSNSLDLGWGIYNTMTHHIVGDSLHVIKLSNGDYKKLQIIQLAGGVYEFKHADLDGSNEVTASVTKSNFTNKNFGYYSITNNNVIDREPSNQDWHIVFTKYVTELYPGTHYGVTGVLSNVGIEVAQEDQVDVITTTTNSSPYQTEINTIGYDWKSFNMTTFGYDITDSLCYFIKDNNNNIWKLILTGFEGSSTGKVVFSNEVISASNTADMSSINSFAIYPNPTYDNNLTILYDFEIQENNENLFIYDMNGRIIKSVALNNKGFNKKEISLNGIKAGLYIISVQVGNETITEKLIIQ